MQNIGQLNVKIEKCINELGLEFIQNKGLILTESDLKCLLFNKLFKIESLSKYEHTQDDIILTIPLHTELSWYNSMGKLAIVPDITIIEPQNLSILHGLDNIISTLPNKQYEFGGNAIIFELKFIRTRTLTKKDFHKQIKKDFDKIQNLFQKLSEEGNPGRIYCYFLIFTKTKNYCAEFNKFFKQYREGMNWKIMVKSADIEFD